MAVNALERYLGDHALAQGWSLPAIEPLDLHRGRIGVIGAGPAGLSFAWQMVRQGWPVTIYDAAPKAGGMLRYGIPAFRLPRAVLDGEIRRIADLGVVFEMGVVSAGTSRWTRFGAGMPCSSWPSVPARATPWLPRRGGGRRLYSDRLFA